MSFKKNTKVEITNGVLWFLFVLLGVFITVAFFEYGLPSLRGDIDIKMFADTHTYEDIATGRRFVPSLISVNSNLFGPVFIFNMMGQSRYAMFIFNLTVVGVSIYHLSQNTKFEKVKFFILMATSAIFIFSFFGVNKEILLFSISMYTILFVRTNKLKFFLLAISLSILVRWQMSIFFVTLLMFWRIPILYNNRIKGVLGFLLLMSFVAGGNNNETLSHVNEIALQGALEEQGSGASGMFPLMLRIQQAYGYFLVFLPKTAMLLFSFIARFDINLISENFWNYFVIMFQCIQNFVLFAYLFVKGRLKLSNDIFFVMTLYCVIFSVTPIFSPRYLYPVSLWAIFEVSRMQFDIRSKLKM